jgi:hypothetical protein
VEIGSEEQGNVTQKFANSQTMILQDFPTKVPCTRQYPQKWKIEGKWYCSHPDVRGCNEAPGDSGGLLTATQLQGSRLWRQLAQC